MMFTAMTAVYVVVHLSGPDGVAALLAKREAIRQLQEDNRQLEDEIENQRKRNDAIRQGHPDVIDPLIRDRTNKVRPGEKDFRFGQSR